MNVVFVERIFPHYRKAVYDIIYKEKKFVFFHSIDAKCGIKQIRAEYSSLVRSFHYGKKESQIILFVLRQLIVQQPGIVIHEFSAGILSKLLLLMFCKFSKTKLIFWGHMYDRTKGFFPEKRISDKYRLWLWRKADSLITYSQAEKELLLKYKIPEEKIFIAFNTVDTNSFLRVRNELEKKGKVKIKEELQFQHKFNLTFIGRLYNEKKPELLLDLLVRLKKKGFESVAVHYVGEGEMLTVLKEASIKLNIDKDVFFHGAIYDELKTGRILFCSDLMVMPGFVGLSVNHAFCFNCPVVTFKQFNLNPPHSPEVEYIIHKKTGFQIPEHTTEALVNEVASFLRSPELQKNMQTEIRNFIENKCSVEKMAQGVLDAISYNQKNNKK